MTDDGIAVVGHAELRDDDRERMQRLFDSEYLDDYGPWSADEPYGYAGHDTHVLAHRGGELIGHVGWGWRTIRVGSEHVVIAGVGGVLVSPKARGTTLGRQLMDAAADSMRRAGDVDFGYLGCREAVAPFYEACGWTRIAARERYVDRLTGETVDAAAGPPLFVMGVRRSEADWPQGPIDLQGRPW